MKNVILIGGKPLPAPEGLCITTFVDPTVHRFTGRSRRGRPVTEIVVHESVTRSVASTVSVLKRRGLGVHLIVGPDGSVTQHGDLADGRLAHAGGHNGPSIGIEFVNPYYPAYVKPGLPWTRVIPAPWAHQGQYVLPTPEQAEACALLVGWLTSPVAEGLAIPRTWAGLMGTHMAMGRVPSGADRQPGIWAHHYSAHADGAWPVLYAWLRLEGGLDPKAAYEEAVRRATGVKGSIDLSDLTPTTDRR